MTRPDLKRGLLAACAVVLAAQPFSAMAAPAKPAAAAPARAASLEADIQGLAAAIDGSVGVAAWRLDGTGPRTLVNADQLYPMASTFKVAVAGRILERVDKGELKLTDMIAVEPRDIVPSEVIADRFIHPGVSLSVYNHLELMLTQSDNTATDVMTRVAGGPAAVTDWVRRQGVENLRVDGATDGIIRRYFELPDGGTFTEVAEAAMKSDPGKIARDGPFPKFDDDPRDTATATAMAELLTRIFGGKALSPESTKVIAGIMERCRTGEGRLKGRMPKDTKVAHKTGTIGGTVNDVGVITLPRDAGQVVVAVYIKKSSASMDDRERVIAEIARSVRDAYLYQAELPKTGAR